MDFRLSMRRSLNSDEFVEDDDDDDEYVDPKSRHQTRMSVSAIDGCRKFSQPIIQAFPTGSKFNSNVPMSSISKRRLSVSAVSEAVGRRLSTSIGWKLGQLQLESSLTSTSSTMTTAHMQVIAEAKALCARYVRARFRRSGILGHRKLDGLRRLRSVVNMTSANCNMIGAAASQHQSRDIFASLDLLGQTLESRHPKTYASVCRNICRTLNSEEAAVNVFDEVAVHLVNSTITWGRVVALFAIAGALSVDCVHQGHVDYVTAVIDNFGHFVERELASWIVTQGGWYALVTVVSPVQYGTSMFNFMTLKMTMIMMMSMTTTVTTSAAVGLFAIVLAVVLLVYSSFKLLILF